MTYTFFFMQYNFNKNLTKYVIRRHKSTRSIVDTFSPKSQSNK